MLPLMQYPTLSDLSSLTSSNASDNRLHLQGTSPAATQSHASPLVSRRQHHMRLLALAKKEPLESTEKQSQAISPPTTVRRRRKRGHRFSVVWKSQSGKTGKRVVHVDEKGHVIHHRPLAVWDDCDHDTSGRILATLFMLGFLFCPCWWAGAFLFLTRRDYFALDVQILYLWTPRTFGHLNVCLSVASLVLIALLTGLAVWYHAVMA
ncbi:hypothetical protein BC940DRAFT_309317 [Gongronella butleri]|nr:hypothetical protein BC940DRAFT_309317 [Gongronella butleri]